MLPSSFFAQNVALAFVPFREPAFAHSLALLKQLADAPERRRPEYGQKGRPYNIADKERGRERRHPRNEEGPPAFYSEIIFALDYQRVKYADYQKCGDAYDYARKVHVSIFCMFGGQR